MSAIRILETIVRRSPLGVRLLDIATCAPVTNGLWVTARPLGERGKTVTALPNRSGVYAMHGLPGLRDFEFGGAEELLLSPPVSPASGKEFAILIEDLQGRYLPVGMQLRLPRAKVETIAILAAPARTGQPGVIALRGSLKDALHSLPDGTARPAAHTLIRAQYDIAGDEAVYEGLADDRGQFVLFLQFPDLAHLPPGVVLGSPNTADRLTLANLQWPVRLSFFYQPGAQQFIGLRADQQAELIHGLDNALAAQLAGLRCIPELHSLSNQSAATVIPPAPEPPAATLRIQIGFVPEIVVKPVNGDGNIWLRPPP